MMRQAPPLERHSRQSSYAAWCMGGCRNMIGDSLTGLCEGLGIAGRHGGTCSQPMPRLSTRSPRPAFRRFPSASPTPPQRPGKQKAAPKDRSKHQILLRKFGAGDGIRTHDPNLGKIAIRPPVPFFPPNEAAGRNQHSDPYTLLIPCDRFFRNNYTCYNIVL